MNTFKYTNIVFCHWKKMLFNNKFYKKLWNFPKIQDLLYCFPETIYKIIMEKNNHQETFINNYNKTWYIKINFWRTEILICDDNFGKLDFIPDEHLGCKECAWTFIY